MTVYCDRIETALPRHIYTATLPVHQQMFATREELANLRAEMTQESDARRQRDRAIDLRRLDMFRGMAARKFLEKSAAVLRLPIAEPANDHTHSVRWSEIAGLISKNEVVEKLQLHPRYAMVPQLAEKVSMPQLDWTEAHAQLLI